ncbi:MAG: hypothetical protein ACREUL_19175 [Steroidobacteraceae bacterium]
MLAIVPTWRGRAIALAKVLIFVILSQAIFRTGMRALHPKVDLSPSGSIGSFLYLELIQLVCAVIIPLGLLLLAFGDPLKLAGWGRSLRARQFLIGLATGLVLIAAVISVLALLGDYSAGPPLLSAGQIVNYGSFYVVAMLFVAIGEESIPWLRADSAQSRSFVLASCGPQLIRLWYRASREHRHDRDRRHRRGLSPVSCSPIRSNVRVHSITHAGSTRRGMAARLFSSAPWLWACVFLTRCSRANTRPRTGSSAGPIGGALGSVQRRP